MVRRKIGEAITDANGVASINYTGSGKGLLQFQAETDDSTIVSEIYELLDCIKMDKGTIAEHSDIWTVSSNATFTRQTDYSVLVGSVANRYISTNIPNECVIELELYQVDGTKSQYPVTFYDNSTTMEGGFSLNHIGSDLETWTSIKIELHPSEMIITNLDKGITVTRSISDVARFVIRNSNDITTIYFRNFKVYPI